MADSEICAWEPVRAFHAVLLQQLENGRANCGDSDKKLEFRRALVWNPVYRHDSTKPQPMADSCQKAGRKAGNKLAPAKPGTKACCAYNLGKCSSQSEHPCDLHICAYCLVVAC